MTTLEDRFLATASPDVRVGERVRMWMYRRGMNQLDIAKVLGIGGTTVSRKLAGKTGWSVSDLIKTAALLDVSVSDLVAEEMVEIEKMRLASAHAEPKPVSEPPVRLELTTFALQERRSTN